MFLNLDNILSTNKSNIFN